MEGMSRRANLLFSMWPRAAKKIRAVVVVVVLAPSPEWR
jgi:hypothetical protein